MLLKHTLVLLTFYLAFASAKIEHCSDETELPIPSCVTCDTGYGLYPNTKGDDKWNTCVSCQDPKYIPNEILNSSRFKPCKECTFLNQQIIIDIPSFQCVTCDPGYFVIGMLDVPLQSKYWNAGCARCPSMCKTCDASSKYCWECAPGRFEVDPRTFKSPDYQGPWRCDYEIPTRLLFLGGIIAVSVGFCLFSLYYLCGKSKTIGKVYITQNIQQNYVDVQNLMAAPNAYNPGAGAFNHGYVHAPNVQPTNPVAQYHPSTVAKLTNAEGHVLQTVSSEEQMPLDIGKDKSD